VSDTHHLMTHTVARVTHKTTRLLRVGCRACLFEGVVGDKGWCAGLSVCGLARATCTKNNSVCPQASTTAAILQAAAAALVMWSVCRLNTSPFGLLCWWLCGGVTHLLHLCCTLAACRDVRESTDITVCNC
jgi:hypothetical protein